MPIRTLCVSAVRSTRLLLVVGAAVAAGAMVGCESPSSTRVDRASIIEGYDYYVERAGGVPDNSVPVAIGFATPDLVPAGRGTTVLIPLDDYADPYGQPIKVTYTQNGAMLRNQISRTFVRPFLDQVSLPLVTTPMAVPGSIVDVRYVSLRPNGQELPPAYTSSFVIDPPGISDGIERDVYDADVMPSTVSAGKGVEIKLQIKGGSNPDGQLVNITYSANAALYLEDTPSWIFVQPNQRRVYLTLLTKAAGTVTMYFKSAKIDGTVVQTNAEDTTFTITP